jgi:hypothetical protein
MDDKEDLDSLTTINLEELTDKGYFDTLANASITIGSPNYSNASITLGDDDGYGYTIGTASASLDPYWANTASINRNGQLNLIGEDADISIDGMSLKTAITEIQQRLNILQPNTKLESEWNQLRELGEQYRKLEAEIIEKQKIWNSLKQ